MILDDHVQQRADGYPASTVATIGKLLSTLLPDAADERLVAANPLLGSRRRRGERVRERTPGTPPGRPTGRPSRSPTTPHAYPGPATYQHMLGSRSAHGLSVPLELSSAPAARGPPVLRLTMSLAQAISSFPVGVRGSWSTNTMVRGTL